MKPGLYYANGIAGVAMISATAASSSFFIGKAGGVD
jgi:hypothetical protein